MKKILLCLVLSACASAPSANRTVRVLTYNIHAGTDEKSQPSIPAIAAFINSMNPDIVMLQEVDRGTARSKGADHLQQLAELTHLHPAFGKSLDYQGGEYGIAVLSRWPVDSATVVPLSVEPPQERSGGSHEPRVALHVRVGAPFGVLHVVNTHIDPAREGTFRKQEVIGLLARVRRAVAGDEPLIFGGDLNTRPNTDEIAAISLALSDAWANCGTGIEYTFPASKPDRRIDYVFYRKARCLQAAVPETYASDHRPLFVTLEIMRRP